MHKILVSVSNDLYARICKAIPKDQRNTVFTKLIETELTRQDEVLYEAALVAESNESLSKKMSESRI